MLLSGFSLATRLTVLLLLCRSLAMLPRSSLRRRLGRGPCSSLAAICPSLASAIVAIERRRKGVEP